jgi:secernin
MLAAPSSNIGTHKTMQLCGFSLFKVSVLSAAGSGKPHCHWFTATPNPQESVFKPFIFTPEAKISQHTYSPVFSDDPAEV